MKLLLCLILVIGATRLHADPTDAEALLFLQKHIPEVHQQVAPLEKSDPADFRNALEEAKSATMGHAKLIAAGDAVAAAAYLKMVAIDFVAISIADDIVQATEEAEKQRLMGKLKEHVAASFEQWAIVEAARIQRMEAELAKLKTELQEAISDKKNVIEQDSATLLEECRTYQTKKSNPKN